MKKIGLSFVFIAILTVSCEKESIESTGQRSAETGQSLSGKKVEAFVDGQKVEGILSVTESGQDQLITQGDILVKNFSLEETTVVFEPGQTPPGSKSVGSNLQYRRWPDGKVYYEIASNLPNQSRISGAIANWEQNTTLRFFKRTNQRNYIRFVAVDKGCSSFLGMQGGRQEIKLSSSCREGTVIHEIGHAVGLKHEQSRSDRDKYLNINYANIIPEYVPNFNLSDPKFNDDYTSFFDVNSIMMYGPYYFAINKKIPTITLKNGDTYRWQRNGLSTGDIAGIKKMYPVKTTNPNPGPDPDPTPTYENNKSYVVYGVKVGRYYDQWWYYNTRRPNSNNGWHKVELKDKKWFYKS